MFLTEVNDWYLRLNLYWSAFDCWFAILQEGKEVQMHGMVDV